MNISKAKVKRLCSYFQDPLKWVLSAYPWGKKGTLLENWSGPNRFQQGVLEYVGQVVSGKERRKHIAIDADHGSGLTTLAVWLTQWRMATWPQAFVGLTANTQEQLHQELWRLLLDWNDLCCLGEFFDHDEQYYWLKRNRASRTSAIAWTSDYPEAFAGVFNPNVLWIFDGCDHIPKDIWHVANGAMTVDDALFIVMGQRCDSDCAFMDCFKAENSNIWKTFISSKGRVN
jgi:hypothetical protein